MRTAVLARLRVAPRLYKPRKPARLLVAPYGPRAAAGAQSAYRRVERRSGERSGPAGPRRCIRQGLRELKWTKGVLAVYHDREALFGRAASRVRNVFRQAE
jgi:hypothetical protein